MGRLNGPSSFFTMHHRAHDRHSMALGHLSPWLWPGYFFSVMGGLVFSYNHCFSSFGVLWTRTRTRV
jgi:hypothetical protein